MLLIADVILRTQLQVFRGHAPPGLHVCIAATHISHCFVKLYPLTGGGDQQVPKVPELPNLSQFIELCDIDATRVIVERSECESAWYMMRMKGIDTML